MENMFLSFLESKILLWKVNFHIYFPQWQVMSKVSVKPWSYPFDVRFIIQSKLSSVPLPRVCEEKDPGNEFEDRVTCASL